MPRSRIPAGASPGRPTEVPPGYHAGEIETRFDWRRLRRRKGRYWHHPGTVGNYLGSMPPIWTWLPENQQDRV